MIKNLLLTFVTIMALLPAMAQNTGQPSTVGAKTYYFKNPSLPISNKDSADYIRMVSPDTTGSGLFIVKDVYRDGKIRLTAKSITDGPFLKCDGPYTEYYKNGNIKEADTYRKGMLTGLAKSYYRNGKPSAVTEYYDNGNAKNRTFYYPNGNLYYTADNDTTAKRYRVKEARDSTGKITAVNGNGTWAIYTANYKAIFLSGPIVNGLKNGEWKGTSEDSTRIVCNYSKGVSVSGTTTYLKTGKVIHFTKDEAEPVYGKGMEAFYSDLAKHMHYPRLAKENGVQGKVILTFMVEKDGMITDIKVARGIGSGCDEEAVKALKQTQQPWIPGQQYGLPIRVSYSVPLTFTLQTD